MIDPLRFVLTAIILVLPAPFIGAMGGTIENVPNGPTASVTVDVPSSLASDLSAEIASSPTYFVRNDGQVLNGEVLFYSLGGGLQVGFTGHGPVYSTIDGTRGFSYNVTFPGASQAVPVPSEEMGHRANFFMGSSEEEWTTDVMCFSRITYFDLYPGLDVTYYIRDGMLKYDIIVRSGPTIEEFRMRFIGTAPRLSDGNIVIDTPLGDVIEDRPISWTSEGVDVSSDYCLLDDGSIAIRTGPIPEGVGLTVDPGIRYSTFIGDNGADIVNDVVVDSNGNVYATGNTVSSLFPTTTGAYDTSYNSGTGGDAFILKLNKAGTSLLYSTFIGGSSNEVGNAIDIDSSGNAYITGRTNSNNFPYRNGYDNTLSGWTGEYDVFVLKLGAAGNSLTYSTYLGGTAGENGYDIKVDSSDRAVITGYAAYSDPAWGQQWRWPYTTGAYDTTPNGNDDAFLLRMDSSGGSLSFATFLGSNQNEWGYALDIDTDGDIYIVGGTTSSNFPTTTGAYDRTHNGGSDVFVVKMKSDGSSLLLSSFMGGSNDERAYGIALNSTESPYITGETASSGFPTTTKAYDTTINGNTDGFLSHMKADLTGVENSTFFGGSGQDTPRDLERTPTGTLMIVGRTYSTNFPTTSDAFYTTLQGQSDVFYFNLAMGGKGLIMSTYLGGSQVDDATCMDLDSEGFVIIGGSTQSSGFPLGEAGLDTTYNQNTDGFILKFFPADFCPRTLVVAAGYFEVDLSWQMPPAWLFGTYSIQGYNIYRGLSLSRMSLVASIGNTTSYNDQIHYFVSRTYSYGVTAVFSTIGESRYSNRLSAVPMVTPKVVDPVTATGDMHVDISWGLLAPQYLSMFTVTYNIYRGYTPDNLAFKASAGLVDRYNDSDISPVPRSYYYAITYSLDGIGEGNISNVVMGEPRTPPASPSDVGIEALDLKMNLSWALPAKDGGAPLLGYDILRGRDPGSLEPIATLPASSVDFIDEDILPGITYNYCIAATNRLGDSVGNGIITATGETIPSAPVSLIAVALDGEVQLTWGPPAEDWGTLISGYVVYGGSSETRLSVIANLGPSSTEFTDVVENGILRSYSVSAVNKHGEGEPSPIVEALPNGRPGPVSSMGAGIGNRTAYLSWGDVTTDGGAPLKGFRVYRGPDVNTRTLVSFVGPSANEFTENGLTNGATYYYWVSALNENGEGPLSTVATVSPGSVSGSVNRLMVEPGLEKVDLTWSPPSDMGGRDVSGYEVLRGSSPHSVRPLLVLGPTMTSISDLHLTAGTTYYYSVRAVNEFGTGALSLMVSGTPVGRPSPPLISSVMVTSRSAFIDWEPPLSDGGSNITEYLVEFRLEGDLEWTEVTTPLTFHTINDLVPGVLTRIRISAKTLIALGAPSEEIDVLPGTLPQPPSAIKAVPGTYSVDLSWTLLGPKDLPVNSVRIFMAIDDGSFLLLAELNAKTTSFLVGGLTEGRSYTFTMSSLNALGEGARAQNTTVFIANAPGQVKSLTVRSAYSQHILLEWRPPLEDGGIPLTGYKLVRTEKGGDGAEFVLPPNVTSYLDRSVKNGKNYTYTISAVNSKGQGALGPSVSAMPLGTPSAPIGFEAVPGSDTVELSWSVPQDNGGSPILGFVLYKSEGSSGPSVISYLPSDVTSFTDKDVSSGSYEYSIVPVNAEGAGGSSSVDVEVPSRVPLALLVAAISFIVPLIIVLLIIFLPGMIRNMKRKNEEARKKRLEEEEKAKKAKEAEAFALAAKSMQRNLPLGGARPMGLPVAPMPAPSSQAPPAQEPKVASTASGHGYIRPSERKRSRKDMKGVLRSDGRTVEQPVEDGIQLGKARSPAVPSTEGPIEKKGTAPGTGEAGEEVAAQDEGGIKAPHLEQDVPVTPAPANISAHGPEPSERTEWRAATPKPPSDEPVSDWSEDEVPLTEPPAESEPEELEEIDELEELEEEGSK